MGRKKTLFSTNLLTEGEKNKQEVGKKEKDVEVENFFYFCESLVGTTEPRPIVDLRRRCLEMLTECGGLGWGGGRVV